MHDLLVACRLAYDKVVGASSNEGFLVNTIIKTTNVCDASSVGDGLADWPVTVGVVEVGVIDTGCLGVVTGMSKASIGRSSSLNFQYE